MTDYAFGDIQGCFDALRHLLDNLNFNDHTDRLWFVGDLVNRGFQSLQVLRFLKNLPLEPRITLGNHDLHFLNQLFCQKPDRKRTSFPSNHALKELLLADDAEELGHWLRQHPLLYDDSTYHIVMCHAGIAPIWDLVTAKKHAQEVEQVLQSDAFCDYLTEMYGDTPHQWSEQLMGIDRLRLITNYFTRMRFCDSQGHLNLSYQGEIAGAPAHLIPWFDVPSRQRINADIIFGHWAALQGKCHVPGIYALDTGCCWGGQLTALRLQDKRRFSISCD